MNFLSPTDQRTTIATGQAADVGAAFAAYADPKPRVCGLCGETFTGICCPPCAEKAIAKQAEEQEAEKIAAKRKHWNETICPPAYRKTDWKRDDVNPQCREIARKWEPGAKPSLILFGETGLCKTRAALWILRRKFAAGRSVYAVSSGDTWDQPGAIRGLSSAMIQQFSDDPLQKADAQSVLRQCRAASFLLIDDVGKERSGPRGSISEACAEVLFNVIDYRAIHGKSTILTTNMDVETLIGRFPIDKQKPLERRLREFFDAPEL